MAVGKTKTSISTSNILNGMQEAQRALSSDNAIAARIGAGMRGMVSLSKALGLGGKLPFTIDKLSSNTKWVLGQLGIDSQAIVRVGQYDSALAKQSETTAQSIFGKVINGVFGWGDAKNATPVMIALARANAAHQKNIARQKAAFNEQTVQASPYAMDLLAFAPKFKFLFVVQFTFNEPYASVDQNFQKQFAFVVKKASRPEVKYQMEDVNYYNHRTKVVTKAEWDGMSMSFYDDGMNNAATFYSLYTRAMSPILNIRSTEELINAENSGLTGSMRYGKPIIGKAGQVVAPLFNTGSTGAIADDQKTIIKEINIFHVYDNGKFVNNYTFMNPRISHIELDDLDMSSSEINTLDIKFEYDSVYVRLARKFSDVGLTDKTNVGRYPLRDRSDKLTQHTSNPNFLYGIDDTEMGGAVTDAAKIMASAQNRIQTGGKQQGFFDKYKKEISTASNLIAGAFSFFGKKK